MNIKYANRKITFKISHDELAMLLQDKKIYCDFIFPCGNKVSYVLYKAPVEKMYITFCNKNTITLQVSSETLETLKTPSKYGAVSSYFNTDLEYFVALEVDLKSKRPEKKHAR